MATPTRAAAATVDEGLDALRSLKSVDPFLFLAPSENLLLRARNASRFLYSRINPSCPKSPLNRLLVEGFDAEQIWKQIELQSIPLFSTLRRELRRLPKNPEEIPKLFGKRAPAKRVRPSAEGFGIHGGVEKEGDDGIQGFENDHDEEGEVFSQEDDTEDEGEKGESPVGDEEIKGADDHGVEDAFFKVNELEEYLKEDEARESGWNSNGGFSKDEDDPFLESEEEDEIEGFGNLHESTEEGADKMDNARYEDFFGSVKGKQDKKQKKRHVMEDDDEAIGVLSTYEREREKIQSEIKRMEKANMDPKTWTMQGEVTALKRPVNSALEVDLDFEHNAQPAPVITEEVTASLEDLIRKRIMEARFDDVERGPTTTVPSRATKEGPKLNESKSDKGLAEIYEDEYAQKAGLQPTPSTFSDKLKDEARVLFKKLCSRLDALSHFHFAPKPVVEDMSVRLNVPALAMEEVAPIAVSDAAMLAPEEVFAGKGDIREEAELTKMDRKRRHRARKKRKFNGIMIP